MVISERTSVPARYRLIEEVGQGGMAIVYRAQDDSLKREVAVKVLHPHLAAEPEAKARLEREAQAVAKLKHDNILEIFDYSGSDADSAYIVTEFIQGETLKEFLGEGRRINHPEVAVLIAAELAGALAHAHGLGVIHRDVKPENVMIRKDGLLKLMDFGIAQVLDLERMTVTGQLLGSPAYMAPELVEGRPLDVRTDVFSVGILLYQMATGALPFTGKNPHEVLRRITDGHFPDPRTVNRLVGAGLARIIARALARDPAARHPDMRTLLGDLREQAADAGLGEPRDELRDYFRDPAAYEQSLPARMTPALAATAARQLGARNAARAMECWNRVLAYAPDDPAVTDALKRWEGRNRRKIAAFVTIGAAAAVALSVGIAGLVSHRGDPTRAAGGAATVRLPASPAQTSVSGHPASSTAGGAPASAAADAIAARRRRADALHALAGDPSRGETDSRAARAVRGRQAADDEHAGATTGRANDDAPGAGATGAIASSATRTFALGPTPQNVDVYLDGQRQFAYDTNHRSLTIPWTGVHVVEFRSPTGCCFVERAEVGPDRPLPPDDIISRKLKWKPARLVVTTSPASSNVRIMVKDPTRPGRGAVIEAGEEANIPFLSSDEAEKDLEVSVDSSAGLIAERVQVRAGERKAIVVQLGIAAPEPGP